DVVAGILAGRIRIEPQSLPAPLLGEGREPLHRRARHDRERDALPDVAGLPVKRAQERGAHRAGPLTLRPEHVAVDGEGLSVAEQLAEARRAILALEAIVFRNLPARRQPSAQLGDALDVPAELDLLGEKRVAGPPVG